MTAESGLNSQTRGLLRRFHLQANKRLGQHFLVEPEVLECILSAAELAVTDTVIEIGPGLGVLTRELARRSGRVIAVEIDNRMASILRRELKGLGNVSIITGDILKTSPKDLLGNNEILLPEASSGGYKIVANLPYYITSPVLRHFLNAGIKPELMVVMVQEEVARVLTAEPGHMSVLSISVQLYGKPVIVGKVPAASFYPVPEVDSAIIKINVYPHPAVPIDDEAGFFKLVRAGFSARRKLIANSLAQGLGLPKVEVLALLEKAGIAMRRRAETLTLEEWACLRRKYIQGDV